jgi:8-oxo-dGTP pyrophosphatase MutT (NUDIX family)
VRTPDVSAQPQHQGTRRVPGVKHQSVADHQQYGEAMADGGEDDDLVDQHWPVSVKGIIEWDGRYVVLRNERGEWELPGGRLEPNDSTPADALRREISEELGLVAEVGVLVDTWIYEVADKRVLMVIYRCTAQEPDRLTFSDEHVDVTTMDLTTLESESIPAGYLRSIERVVATSSGGGFVSNVDVSEMRKQYHFSRGEHGLDAWDVDRLIALTVGLEIERVPLSSVTELDEVYWFNSQKTPTVRAVIDHVRLIDAADPSYPVILGPDGRVMDGMHRIARAVLAGLDSIDAVRLRSLPPPDYRNCSPDDLPYDR